MTQTRLQSQLERAEQWRDTLVRDMSQAESLVEWLHAHLALVVECETEIALLKLASQLDRDGIEPSVAIRVAVSEVVRGLLAPPSYDLVRNCIDTLRREAILRLVRKYCTKSRNLLDDEDNDV